MNIVTIPVVDEKGRIIRTEVSVEFKGKICPYVKVEGQTAKRLLGHEIIKKDLNACMQILEALESKFILEPILQNALWESFITKYGRCFADANMGRGVKLEVRDIFNGATTDLKEHHDYLMNERNNFSAHAGNSDSDRYEVRLALIPESKGKKKHGFYLSRDVVISPTLEAICAHKQLIVYVIDRIELKLDLIYKRLKEDFEKIDVDELYQSSK